MITSISQWTHPSWCEWTSYPWTRCDYVSSGGRFDPMCRYVERRETEQSGQSGWSGLATASWGVQLRFYDKEEPSPQRLNWLQSLQMGLRRGLASTTWLPYVIVLGDLPRRGIFGVYLLFRSGITCIWTAAAKTFRSTYVYPWSPLPGSGTTGSSEGAVLGICSLKSVWAACRAAYEEWGQKIGEDRCCGMVVYIHE